MKRRILLLCLATMLLFTMTGCYDSRDMNEINIVAGIAIDKGGDDQYKITLEIVDLSSNEETSGSETILVESDGPTIFEAVRNTKLKLFNKLYFGNMHTIIISQQLAREDGISEMLDVLLRDIEPRENVSVLVSQEESARALIAAEGLDTKNISSAINKIILEDKQIASNTKEAQMYQVYNIIHTPGQELVLPAFHLTKNDGKQIVAVSGIAIFKEDRLVGFLSAVDTHFFLISTENESRGALSFPSPQNNGSLIAVEIYESRNKTTLSYSEDQLAVRVAVDVKLGITEHYVGATDGRSQEELIEAAQMFLARRIREVFTQLQQDPGCDIYGFGKKLYEDQYPLWQALKDQWESIFRAANFEVQVRASIVNTGLASRQ